MGHLSTLLLAWLLVRASFHVQAYTIHPSCSNYITLFVGTTRADLIPMLKEAMEEGRSMARLGERDIKKEAKDEYDDSKASLFRGVSEAQLTMAQTNYKDLSDAHWQFTGYVKGTKELTLYCGDTAFASDNGEDWTFKDTDKDGDFTFSIPKDRVRQTGGKWRLCGAKSEATTMTKTGVFNAIMLCNVLDKVDEVKGVQKPEDRGTYAQLHKAQRLTDGSSLRIRQDLVRVVSKTLLHEMFHVVIGKPRILGSGKEEIYGWESCTGERPSSLTVANRVKNAETLALYAATRKISALDEDFGFSSGVVISRKKAKKATEDKELKLQERIHLLFDRLSEA